MDEDLLLSPVYEGLEKLLSDVPAKANLAKGFVLAAAAGACDESADCADCSDCKDCLDCSSDCRSDCSDCSDTPTYRVTVNVYLDGSYYDSASTYYYRGSSTTVKGWVLSFAQYEGLTYPPHDYFSYATKGSGGSHLGYDDTITVTGTTSIYVYYVTPSRPQITITGGSLSASTITSGDSITMTWTTSGDKESIGSWQLTRTDTPTYTDPVSIGSYNQDHAKSHTMTWGPTGTYYIWVFYYGETGSSTYTSNVYCIGTLTVNPAPVKYTLSVYSYLNGTLFDSGTVSNVTSGTTNTCMGWASAAGVSMPPSPAEFQKFNWAGNDFTNLSTTLTVSANTVLRIYYTQITIHVKPYIFHNGWKEATPYIFNGQWKEVEADVYDNGWQND